MERLFKSVAGNWKTTTVAVLAAVTALSNAVSHMLDSDPMTNPDWNLVLATVIAASGLLFAKDSDKTSEDLDLYK